MTFCHTIILVGLGNRYETVSHYLFSGDPPSLPELLRLRVPQQVGAHYSIFGIILLNDETGSRMRSFKQASLGDPEDVVLRVLQEWLEGKGLPVTWESLIQTLRDTDLSVLADKIALKILSSH